MLPNQTRTSQCGRRHTGCFGVVMAVCALWMMTGCETISQDFELLTRTLTPPSPSEAAEMMVNQHNPDLRREGVTWIANSTFGGAEPYLRQYRLMVELEQDPTALAAAIRALARHGEPDDATRIATRLNHPNEHVRWEAARGLQRLHNPDVVSDLLAALRSSEERSDVRVAAAHALGQYPQDRVFQALVSALDARELAVNQTAARSLATLTGWDFGDDAREWLRWYRNADRGERFADQREYRFATYMRDETWFERIVPWQVVQFEQPGLPAGLDSPDRRRTYDETDDGESSADG